MTTASPQRMESSFELSIEDRVYRVQSSTLGCGYRSKVRNGVNKATGARCAIKMVQKSQRESVNDRARREIELLKKVQGHPNIVRLFDSCEDANYIYLVLERHEMTLLDHIERSGGKLSPARAAFILKMVISALEFCQSLNINHLDLKLENVMLNAQNMPVLIDFGFAEEIQRGQRLAVGRGSFRYVPPEIAGYEEFEPAKADIWALGVLLYAMCAGKLPFAGTEDNIPRLFRQIRSGRYDVPAEFSDALRDLVGSLLRIDPALRLELPQIAAHPFMALAVGPSVAAAANSSGAAPIFTAATLNNALRLSSNALSAGFPGNAAKPAPPMIAVVGPTGSCSNLLLRQSGSLATVQPAAAG